MDRTACVRSLSPPLRGGPGEPRRRYCHQTGRRPVNSSVSRMLLAMAGAAGGFGIKGMAPPC
jgi:hypothetical protein